MKRQHSRIAEWYDSTGGVKPPSSPDKSAFEGHFYKAFKLKKWMSDMLLALWP